MSRLRLQIKIKNIVTSKVLKSGQCLGFEPGTAER